MNLPDLDGFAVCELLAWFVAITPGDADVEPPLSDLRRRIAQRVAAWFVAKDQLSGAALMAFAE